MKLNKKILALCLIVIAGIVFWAFYNGLIVRKYEVNTSKIDQAQSFRIVLVTDLHSHIYGKEQSKIINLIERQKPDIILLGGDIADDIVPIEGTRLFLEGIVYIAPVYYVTGNHEYWSNDIKNIKSIIKSYGVVILENQYEQISLNDINIIVAGVEDPDIVRYENPRFDWEGEFLQSFSSLENNPLFKILLAHRPERIELYKKSNFDLILSGHSHGGQVRIPLLINGLYAPNQEWFPKYAGGLYKHERLTHIVSRGVSFNPRMPRMFNPPEIVVIDIKGL